MWFPRSVCSEADTTSARFSSSVRDFLSGWLIEPDFSTSMSRRSAAALSPAIACW